MNPFAEFLLLLWKVVRFLLELSLYVICFCLFIGSFALPWRWPHILTHLGAHDGEDIRLTWVMHFMFTLLDAVTLPFAIGSFIVPTRTMDLFNNDHESSDLGYSVSRRCSCICIFFGALADLVFLPFFFLALVVPTRTWATLKFTCQESKERRDFNVFRWAAPWFFLAMLGLLDLVSAAFGILAFATGIRSCQTWREIRAALNCDSKERSGVENEMIDNYFYNLGVRKVLLRNGALVLIDVFFVPVALVTILSPCRFVAVLKELKESITLKTRLRILQQFGHAILDLVLLVPTLLVVLTGYRSRMLMDYWSGNTASLPFCCRPDPSTEAVEPIKSERPCKILTQGQWLAIRASGLLLMDAACLPALILLFVTGYRFRTSAQPRVGIEFHKVALSNFGALLLDLPFILMGLVVLCTVYRADMLIGALYSLWKPEETKKYDEEMPPDSKGDEDTSLDCQLRSVTLVIFLSLVRDILMLLPFTLLFVSIYRVPSLLLALKVKLSKRPTTPPLMQVLSCEATIAKPNGKPRLDVRASKAPELHGLKNIKLRILGDDFWVAVANSVGHLKASAAQALMPVTLHGRNVDLTAIMPGSTEANLSIEFDPVVTFDEVVSELKKLPGDVQSLLQLEATLEDGQQSVLLTIGLPVSAFVVGLTQGVWPVESILDSAQAQKLQPANEQPRRDIWWSVVATESLYLLKDVVNVFVHMLHIVLALLLIVVPWRLISALTMIFESPSRRSARFASDAMACFQEWEQTFHIVARKLGSFMNKASKKLFSGRCQATQKSRSRLENCVDGYHYESREGTKMDWEICLEQEIACWCCLLCPGCPNYPYFPGDEPDCWRREDQAERSIHGWLRREDKQLRVVGHRLSQALEMWPEDSQWQNLRTKMDTHLAARAEELFHIMMPHNLHAERDLDMGEHHALVSERSNFDCMQSHKLCEQSHKLIIKSFKTEYKNASSTSKFGIRSAPVCREIIRNQLVKGVSDLLAIPGLLLLALSIYRVPDLCKDISELPVRNCPAIKRTVKKNLVGLAWDIVVFVEFLILVAILAVTVVKLPDFLNGMRPHMGLRANVGWALIKVQEVIMGLVELLFLLTAWKSYRLVLSAATFAALCPATILAMALPSRCPPKCRFAFASILWIGLVLICVFCVPIVPLAAHQPAILVIGLGVMTCLGLWMNGTPGWFSPAPGEWWNPSARWTAPNLLVLLGIAVEAAGLSLVASGQQSELMVTISDSMSNSYALYGVVLAFVLLTTLPWVAADEERRNIIAAINWRAAVSLFREVFFLPIAWLLTQAADSTMKTLAIVFFLYFATFLGVSCDVKVTRQFFIDVRSPEFFFAGTRLVLASALLCRESDMAFLYSCAALCVWVLVWGVHGCSVLWVQVLRFGVGAAAVATMVVGVNGFLLASSIAVCLAVVVGSISHCRRRQAMRNADIPASLQKLRLVQGRLGLWGDTFGLSLSSSVPEVANHLLLLEDRLPLERLTKGFMTNRPQWRQALKVAEDYSQIKDALKQLACGIATPVPSKALTQVLCQIPVQQRSYFPQDLAALVVSFVATSEFKWSNLRIEMPEGPRRLAKDTDIDLPHIFKMAREAAKMKSTELAKSLKQQTTQGEHGSNSLADVGEFLSESSCRSEEITLECYPKALGGTWEGRQTL